MSTLHVNSNIFIRKDNTDTHLAVRQQVPVEPALPAVCREGGLDKVGAEGEQLLVAPKLCRSVETRDCLGAKRPRDDQ
jgi:hypothetical protein